MLDANEITLLTRIRWLGVVAFVAAAIYAPLQLVLPPSVRGAAMVGSPALQIVVAVTWLIAAAAMIWRVRPLWFAVVLGPFVMVTYGMFVGMRWFFPGLPFLAAGLVLLYVLVKTAPLFRQPIERVSGSP